MKPLPDEYYWQSNSICTFLSKSFRTYGENVVEHFISIGYKDWYAGLTSEVQIVIFVSAMNWLFIINLCAYLLVERVNLVNVSCCNPDIETNWLPDALHCKSQFDKPIVNGLSGSTFYFLCNTNNFIWWEIWWRY